MNNRFTQALVVFLYLVIHCSVALSAGNVSLSGEVIKEHIDFGGMQRTYLVYIPSGELSSPALIIALHGSLGTGEKMREVSGFQYDLLADRKKCIVVYPDGYKKHWNDCRTVPDDDAHLMNIDDVGFVFAIIEACASKWHIDPARVFVTGLSNGGHMCFRLAAEIPEKIAGIAAIGAGMPAPGVSKCPALKKRVPVMIVNGTDDPINPYEGGMVRLLYFMKKGEVLSSIESAGSWLNPESREAAPVVIKLEDRDSADGSHVECMSWPDSHVRLYTVFGGGHTIPGGRQYLPKFIVGGTNRDMDTAEEMWGFFNSVK